VILDLYKEWFFTLAFSGMRPGERVAVKKSDLDFNKNTLRISKTLYCENNNMKEYVLDTTKTNRSRIIDMDESIMKMLKQLVRSNDFHKKNLTDRMKRLLKFSEVEKELTPHSFRHTHISMMTEAGAELSTIMERVGHIDPNTTLKVYTHVTEKMKVTSIKNVTSHHTNILEKLSF